MDCNCSNHNHDHNGNPCPRKADSEFRGLCMQCNIDSPKINLDEDEIDDMGLKD